MTISSLYIGLARERSKGRSFISKVSEIVITLFDDVPASYG